MGSSFVSCAMHCVFSTKGRRNLIPANVQDHLWSYLGGIARNNHIKALAVGGIDNHVHMLLSLPATVSISKAIQLIKGGASKWLKEAFPACHDFSWQEGYGAFSVSQSMIPQTISYINSQREHHSSVGFDEEFVAFLNKHNIDYDPKYIYG